MSNLEIVFTLCIPILLVGLGMGMKTKTPKKNRWIGWRTPAAMKNETIFKKANIYAGKIMFRYGFVILILTSIIDIILRYESIGSFITPWVATVYKGNIIKNLIMDCQSYTKYRPNETTGGIFVSWRRKEELPTGA